MTDDDRVFGQPLTREEVPLKDFERDDIGRSHRRITEAYLDDDSEKPYLLSEPLCEMCHHPWGRFGCPTTRLLLRLSIEERAFREAQELANRAGEALALIAVKGDIWAEKSRDVLFMKVQVAGEMVRTGKVDILHHSLARIAREFKPFFEKRGAA